jgi:hypothetical protein
MATKTLLAMIKGQSFPLTFDEEDEEFIKEFCGCTIINNILIEKSQRKKKKGSKNVTKAREPIQ